MSVGGVVLPLVVASGLASIGWRNIWLINAAIAAFIVLPAVLLIVRETGQPSGTGLHYLDADGAPRCAGASPRVPAAKGGGSLKTAEILGSIKFWRIAVIAIPLGLLDRKRLAEQSYPWP